MLTYDCHLLISGQSSFVYCTIQIIMLIHCNFRLALVGKLTCTYSNKYDLI